MIEGRIGSDPRTRRGPGISSGSAVARRLLHLRRMTRGTPTLLDPSEVGAPRPPLPSVDQATEWFDRAELWEPEPIDRRWRARGWTDDD